MAAWQVSLCQGNKCHLNTSVISKIYLCAGVFACAWCMACPRRPEEGVMSPELKLQMAAVSCVGAGSSLRAVTALHYCVFSLIMLSCLIMG